MKKKGIDREALQKLYINLEKKCMKIQEEKKQKEIMYNCKKTESNYASDACEDLILC